MACSYALSRSRFLPAEHCSLKFPQTIRIIRNICEPSRVSFSITTSPLPTGQRTRMARRMRTRRLSASLWTASWASEIPAACVSTADTTASAAGESQGLQEYTGALYASQRRNSAHSDLPAAHQSQGIQRLCQLCFPASEPRPLLRCGADWPEKGLQRKG